MHPIHQQSCLGPTMEGWIGAGEGGGAWIRYFTRVDTDKMVLMHSYTERGKVQLSFDLKGAILKCEGNENLVLTWDGMPPLWSACP